MKTTDCVLVVVIQLVGLLVAPAKHDFSDLVVTLQCYPKFC